MPDDYVLPVTFGAWPMIVIPGFGAVCPAIVRFADPIVSHPCRPAGDKLIVPATSNTMVRPVLGAVVIP